MPYRIVAIAEETLCLEDGDSEDLKNAFSSDVMNYMAAKAAAVHATGDLPTIDERLRRAQQAAMAEDRVPDELHLSAVIDLFAGAYRLYMKHPDRFAEIFQQAGIVAREALAEAGDPVMPWPAPAAETHASRLYTIPPKWPKIQTDGD